MKPTDQNQSPASEPKAHPASKDALSHAVLAAPVFLLYQIGLLISPGAANGVDPITRQLGYLAGLSWPVYLAVVAGLTVIYALALRSLAGRHRFQPSRFLLVLGEGLAYALLMGPAAHFILGSLHLLGEPANPLQAMGPIDRIIASAGAGFYEELIFRLAGLGGLLWLLGKRFKRWQAVVVALLVISLIFSAMHYIGTYSEDFDLGSFSYRAVLGIFLGLMFIFRGFGTAVWAHFLYDVYVMLFVLD